MLQRRDLRVVAPPLPDLVLSAGLHKPLILMDIFHFGAALGAEDVARTPSARMIARLMTAVHDDVTKSEAILVAAIEVDVPELVVARTTIGDVQSMIRSKTAGRLAVWLGGSTYRAEHNRDFAWSKKGDDAERTCARSSRSAALLERLLASL